jgi:hypothetical protein
MGDLPSAIQRRLCHYYGLADVPDVTGFLRVSNDVARERVLVREEADAVDVRVELPAAVMRPERSLDDVCQIVEGISHFVLIAERARCELPTTQLELELQAEVDKFVVLGVIPEPLPAIERARLRWRLFDTARFAHPAGTLVGDRYRMASRTAERFIHRLEREYLAPARLDLLRRQLCRFFRAGQTAKLELARAA